LKNKILGGLNLTGTATDNKPSILGKELLFHNTLISNTTSLALPEIWNDNPEISYTPKKQKTESTRRVNGLLHKRWELGYFYVKPEDLKITSGTKYFSIMVNNTYFP